MDYDAAGRASGVEVLGGRDDATCRRLLGKVGAMGETFVTDDWERCHRVIPQAQPFTGKGVTFAIEQGDSRVRHCLVRFRRRTKVVSSCRTMMDLPLRLPHHLQHPAAFATSARRPAAVFRWKSLLVYAPVAVAACTHPLISAERTSC